MVVREMIVVLFLTASCLGGPEQPAPDLDEYAGMPNYPHLDYDHQLPSCQISAPSLLQNGSHVYLSDNQSCYGLELSPEISWDKMHPMTVSTAVMLEEQTTINGVVYHWGVYDLPPHITSLRANIGMARTVELKGYSEQHTGEPLTIKQATNSFGKVGYTGPCPSKNETHLYTLRVYQLDLGLNIPRAASVQQMKDTMSSHVLMECELILEYKYHLPPFQLGRIGTGKGFKAQDGCGQACANDDGCTMPCQFCNNGQCSATPAASKSKCGAPCKVADDCGAPCTTCFKGECAGQIPFEDLGNPRRDPGLNARAYMDSRHPEGFPTVGTIIP